MFRRILIKITHWEYWPTELVYGPVFPVFLWYCLRARSFFFTTAANPGIEYGGLIMESKYSIDAIVPAAYRPCSLLFQPGTPYEQIEMTLLKNGFVFPLIIKPDIGGKGMGVTKVENRAQLEKLTSGYPVPFLVQPFMNLPQEIGLFWCRLPGEERGTITGIVRKEFLEVTGDGKKTVRELLNANDRYLLQLPALEKGLADKMDQILPAGKNELLVPYGNHARGALFLDESRLISKELIDRFNQICNRIDGFYFGRLDIRYNDWASLEKGENFCIIEVNGSGSEPTHIYDPGHSLLFAWKEIIRHWKLLWIISMKNKKQAGIHWISLKDGVQLIKNYYQYMKKCKEGFTKLSAIQNSH